MSIVKLGKIVPKMSNDDSFNDSDEIFSLYSSKKVTDTFKAQLKKIAANNHQLNNAVPHVNNVDIQCKEGQEKSANKFSDIIEKEENLSPAKEPGEHIVVIGDESPNISAQFNDDSLEDSIEIITEITPTRSIRQSERLRIKRVQTRSGTINSRNINADIVVSKPTCGRNNGKKRKKQQKKTIDEVTLDDSPQNTETDDELNPELSVKVIWKSVNIKKFQIRKFQKLSYIFEQLSKEENIPEDKIILTFNNVQVNRNDTPDSLNLQVYHFLDGGVLSELSNFIQTADKETCDSNSDSLVVKFQDANKKIIKINIHKNEKLKVGMIKCSEQLEIPLDKIRFFFDGELVEPCETPFSLGLENEEVIDFKICG